MTLDAAARNLSADAVGDVAVKMRLHTADPGSGAANEVVGGGYTAQTIAWNAASGGIAALSAAAEFDVPAVTIAWVTIWDVTGTTRYGKAELLVAGVATPAVFPVAGTLRVTAASINIST